ncbi:MAG TPA: Ig-like domain-containing protein [Eudoraea sp.]|nr:Ig-like domain-containing protein [Eudoraea sp.]
MKLILKTVILCLLTSTLFSQSNCTPIPEVNFPGGRVILTFDGNVHDDDDILALPYSTGLWWAAGLEDKVVQVEYNNHVCFITSTENDGSGAGSGDDSQNMRTSAAGAISRFGYSQNIFYDYETQGGASTNKMASEIEKSTASNPLWIIAGGPMETVWRGLENASTGFDHVTIISHSAWNESHLHCSNSHNWNSLKTKYQSRGVYFVGNCGSSGCNQPGGLNDQNGGFSSSVSNWNWMQNSNKEYNRWIFGRNPFGTSKFDPSDAGMSYFLISGGPFNGGNKTPNHVDAQKLMENPCSGNIPSPTENDPPSLSISTPSANSTVTVGSSITVNLAASDSDGYINKHTIYVDGKIVDTDGTNYTPYQFTNIAAGSYDIMARVTDNDGASTTKTVTVTAGNGPGVPDPGNEPDPENLNPTLSISAPGNGSVVQPGTDVTVHLIANDPDGTIAKHQVYVNNILYDTDGSNYTPHIIKGIRGGNHVIRATVTDNEGATATSSITITAESGTSEPNNNTPPQPTAPTPDSGTAPTVYFNSPYNNQVVAPGSTVTISISAKDPDGQITKHQIFVNGILIDTDGTTFTETRINNISAGSHLIKATVTDNSGETNSASIVITAGSNANPSPPLSSGNSTPVVNIVSPGEDQNFPVGSTVSVNLGASDSDGSIVKHQIYVNNILVDTDGSFFTTHKINNVRAGNYVVSAKVTDNEGAASSQSISFTVGSPSQRESPETIGTAAPVMEPFSELFDFQGETTAAPFLIVAPNPVSEKNLQLYQSGNTYLRIVNLSGIVLKELPADRKTMQIDLSGLPPGFYILSSDKVSAKFILE